MNSVNKISAVVRRLKFSRTRSEKPLPVIAPKRVHISCTMPKKIVITIKNLPASESERLYTSIDIVLLHPFRCRKASPISPVRLIHVVAMDNIELYEAIFDLWVAGDHDLGR